jgi:small GTP-binding protein
MVERINIVFIGDCGVGKTSIIAKFRGEPSIDLLRPTVGVDNTDRVVAGRSGTVLLRLFDTAGQERYRAMAPLYFKSANVVAMVYDLSARATLENLSEAWHRLIAEHAPKECTRVLIGNKSDLGASIEGQEVEQVKDRTEAAAVFTVSAKTGTGIDGLFNWIANSEFVARDQSYQEGVSAEMRLELTEKKECC